MVWQEGLEEFIQNNKLFFVIVLYLILPRPTMALNILDLLSLSVSLGMLYKNLTCSSRIQTRILVQGIAQLVTGQGYGVAYS